MKFSLGAAWLAAAALAIGCGRAPMGRSQAPSLFTASKGADVVLPADSATAMRLVDSLGPKARENRSSLILLRSLDHPNAYVGSHAAWWLAQAGPSMVAPLIEGLSDRSPAVQTRAAYALGELGPKGVKAQAALLSVVASGTDSAANMASWALSKVAPRQTRLRVQMLRALRFDETPGRSAATADAGWVRAPESVPLLVHLLADTSSLTQRLAAESILRMGLMTIPALEQASRSPDAQLRIPALLLLERIRRSTF